MSALLASAGLAEVMAAPSVAGVGLAPVPLDLISDRTSPRERCPNSFMLVGILGTWAALVNAPCGRWSCRVCGERKAQRYAGIARRGCELAGERLRLVTITAPGGESPADSWSQLGARWGRLAERLARGMGRRLTYFGTVELQKRGNPHLHLLTRDSGYIPKRVLADHCFAVGFGFSDVRQIATGSGVQYVTKYLHKSAGQEMPRGARRIRRSRDWLREPPAIVSRWGPGWEWQSVEGLEPEYVERQLAAAGVLTVFRYEQQAEVSHED